MIDSALQLRPALSSDVYALWLWANDPATRSAAFDRAPISWPEHLAWLSRNLDSGHVRVWIAFQYGDLPVGSIRFDTTDDWTSARLSYVVAPEARGAGNGKRLIEIGVEQLRRDFPSVAIFADVRANNIASLRVFRGLYWLETLDDDGTSRFSKLRSLGG